MNALFKLDFLDGISSRPCEKNIVWRCGRGANTGGLQQKTVLLNLEATALFRHHLALLACIKWMDGQRQETNLTCQSEMSKTSDSLPRFHRAVTDTIQHVIFLCPLLNIQRFCC